MRFIDFYFIEIKYRIFYFLVSLILTLFIIYFYIDECVYLFSYPILETNILKLFQSDSAFDSNRLIYTNATEAFIINLKFSFLFANIICFINLLIHFILFIIPSLYKSEYFNLVFFFLLLCLMFFISLFVIYYILIPNIWSFLVSFERSDFSDLLNIKLEAKISEYFDFIFNIFCYLSVIFQFPLFMIVLFLMNIITINKFIFYRKYIVLISLVVGALISPPDVFSQILLAIPLIILFEITIICLLLVKAYLLRE
jgi:sec-independent protein translocase protein TatC